MPRSKYGRPRSPAVATPGILSGAGRRQAVLLGSRVRGLAQSPNRIVSSNDAQEAAMARIAGAIANVPVTITAELRPLDIGYLAGLPDAQKPAALWPYFAEPERAIPGGQSVADWRRQHSAFMQRVGARAASKGRAPAFVTRFHVLQSAPARN